jgi:integrase
MEENLYENGNENYKNVTVEAFKRHSIEIPSKFTYRAVYDRNHESAEKTFGLIQLVIYDRVSRRRLITSTGIRIEEQYWNNKARKIVGHPNSDEYNYALYNFIRNVEALELDYIKRGIQYNLSTLKADIKNHRKPHFNISFNEFSSLIVDETEGERAKSSNKNLRGTIAKLDKFKKKIEFDEVDTFLVKKFQKWLSEDEKQKPNTVTKHLSLVRFLVNKAIQKGYMTHEQNPFRSGEIKMQKIWTTEHKNLTVKELEKYENWGGSDGGMKATALERKVIDMFLLSCYTGLRFSDVISLKNEHIVEKDGTVWIVKNQVKTKAPVNLPIGKLFDGKALKLIDKYKNIEQMVQGVRNQIANAYVRKVTESLGIVKEITFHSGRHTFSSLLSAQGLSLQYVAKLTGHTNVATLKSYVTIDNSDVIEQLEKVGN